MLTLTLLTNYLEELLNNSNFTDYCHNGLQVEGKSQISKIVTGVSCTLQLIEEAVKERADAIIVHHGLFWNRDDHQITGIKKKKLKLLLENEISLLAYHLPLDAHVELGNNFKAAQDLGFYHLEPYNVGVKAKFDPISRVAFQEKLEKYYGQKAHVALGGKEEVSSAVIISGGAYKEINHVAKLGVDCFITGSFDEPVWNTAFEEGINFFALGHTATEKVGPKALAHHLEDKFSLPVSFIDTSNPF